jgi:eukaryotic-like serine/threonine-protein kinase
MDEQTRRAAEAASSNTESDQPPPVANPGPGSSVGSSRPILLETDQKTVISKSPPRSPAPLPASVKDLSRQLLGERLGHFVLEEFVGGGGMGAVFRARDMELGRTVAVKVVSAEQNDEDMLRRFKNEAQSAARLDHQNIARVYYVGEDRGLHYIVFEFIEGVNIRDLVLHKGPLSLEEAVVYTLQVAEALDHAAKRDVVHRDIKPSNVLVMQNGTVKLVDMGLARLHQVESPTHDLTASGVTLGTFDYISPEQARDPRNADVRSDLYSLGCTLYFMLTGCPPFPEGTVLQKLLSHSSDPPPDPREYRPDLGQEVTQVVHRLLAKNPNDRYQSPAEFIAALLLMADDQGLSLAGRKPTVVVTRANRPLSRLETHLPWVVPTAALLVVVLLIEVLSSNTPTAMRPPDLPARARIEPPATSAPDAARNAASDPGSAGTPASTLAAQLPSTSASGAAPPNTATPPNNTNNTSPGAAANSSSASPVAGTPNAARDPSVPTMPPGTAVRPPAATGDSPPPMDRPIAGNGSPDTVGGNTVGGNTVGGSTVVGTTAGNTAAGNTAAGSTVNGNAAAGSSADSGPPTAPVPPTPVRRIIVAPTLDSIPADAVHLTSLSAALQQVADFPAAKTIELQFDGLADELPVQTTIEEQLQIRAVEGYSPVLRFRPDLSGAADARNMIELSGGNSRWEGVHFQLELPTAVSEGWSLFALRDVELAEFNNCTFTIQNVDEYGRALHPQVAFFRFLPPKMPKRMDMEMEMGVGPPMPKVSSVPPNLELRNCAARGQATFLRADIAHPLNVSWEQGLLITNERLFSFGGAVDAPERWDGRIELRLSHVTAIVDDGVGLVQLTPNASRLVDVLLEPAYCVFLVSQDSPLLEHQAVPALDRIQKTTLEYGGDQNFYPTRKPGMSGASPLPRRIRWRIITNGGQTIDYGFDQKSPEYVGAEWYEERSAKEAVSWKNLQVSATGELVDEAQLPHHLQSKWEYQLRSPARGAGFDYEALPGFPRLGPSQPEEALATPAARDDD